MKYTVTQVIRDHLIDNGKPVSVLWYTGDSLAQAMSALSAAAAKHETDNHQRWGVLTDSVTLTIDNGVQDA